MCHTAPGVWVPQCLHVPHRVRTGTVLVLRGRKGGRCSPTLSGEERQQWLEEVRSSSWLCLIASSFTPEGVTCRLPFPVSHPLLHSANDLTQTSLKTSSPRQGLIPQPFLVLLSSASRAASSWVLRSSPQPSWGFALSRVPSPICALLWGDPSRCSSQPTSSELFAFSFPFRNLSKNLLASIFLSPPLIHDQLTSSILSPLSPRMLLPEAASDPCLYKVSVQFLVLLLCGL